MKTNIAYEESLEILNALDIPTKGYEMVFFGNSLNRVLAQDILAQENMPEYPTSAMDGYAFSSKDLQILQTKGLKVVAINKAGETQEMECLSGQCIKTFTGARMPKNCDTLVLIEHSKEENGILTLMPQSPLPQANQWIRQIGENYKNGEILLHKGVKITPFEIGLLAELNRVFVPVFIPPKVAILGGGDEIIEVGEEKRENTIRSVNNHLLKAICTSLGAEAFLFSPLKDCKETIKAQILEALKNCDILVTSGGASKGDFDFIQEVLKELCVMQFKGVRMKPGKPVGFGVYENKTYVFSLPGFPNSCAVTFMLFVKKIIEKMQGIHSKQEMIKATLMQDIKRVDSRAEFRICNVRINKGEYEVGFWDKKTLQSSVINNFCNSSALIFLQEGGGDLKSGEKVEILLLDKLILL